MASKSTKHDFVVKPHQQVDDDTVKTNPSSSVVGTQDAIALKDEVVQVEDVGSG